LLLILLVFTFTLTLVLRLVNHTLVRYMGFTLLALFASFQLLMLETKQRFAIFLDIEEFYLTGYLGSLSWTSWLWLALKGLALCLFLLLLISQGRKFVAFSVSRLPSLAWLYYPRNVFIIALFTTVFSLVITSDLYRSIYVTVKHSLVNAMFDDDFEQGYSNIKSNNLNEIFSDSHFGSPYSIIAHAGGGWFNTKANPQLTMARYTNSIEAVQQSISDGKHLIELDLLTTSDGELIAGHDWPRVKALLAYKGIRQRAEHDSRALSYHEFVQLRSKSDIKPLDIGQVNNLFKQYSHLILVTDKTQNYLKLVQSFDFPERLIVECFSLYQCQRAKRYGIEHTALNINLANNDIVDYLHRNQISMVTFRGVSEADTKQFELAKALFSSGIISLVYTSKDDLSYFKQHIGVTASAIYSDYFSLKSQHLVN
jgi:hypothetical protein